MSELTKMTRDEIETRLELTGNSVTSNNIVCLCHNGNDSQIASQHLKTVIGDSVGKVVDIIGGLEAWAKQVDHSFPQY